MLERTLLVVLAMLWLPGSGDIAVRSNGSRLPGLVAEDRSHSCYSLTIRSSEVGRTA